MRLRLKHQRLAELLARSGLSQNHWAMRIGVSRGHWSELLNGKHPYPSPKTRNLILEALKVPVEELFDIEVGIDPVADVDFRRAISDRYIIDTELGQGGMGAVYLARDVRHGRVVAVKVISPEAVSGIGLNQFHREISTIAQLQHPNILPLFDSGDAAGHPFYVMPWVRGGSLRARLQRDVRLDLATVLRLTRDMAEALQHAHNERILHCDVKPENVLLHGDHAWVMDFGIARKLHSEIGEWPLRKELDISAGTPAYVSPEQASGDANLDARSDVYSLGCIVYEMLAGRTPFGGTSTQEIVATRFIVPPPPVRDYAPEVPSGVASVLERAMALPREHRPETAAAFAAELEQASQNASRILAAASLTTTRAISRARQRLKRSPAHSVGGMVRSIWQDFRYATRALSNRPGFAAAAILTLALGIGASTAIFSVVYGVLLKPLPFSEPERLVSLAHTAAGPAGQNHGPATYFTYRNNQRVFEDVGVWERIEATITGGADPERVQVLQVSDATLPLLRVQAFRGRVFTKEDDAVGRPLRAILTYGYWQRRFGGADSAIGHALIIDGAPVEVIGVLPPSFRFLRENPSLLLPQQLDPASACCMQFDFQVLGRLKAGVTLAQANADVGRMIPLLPRPHEILKLQPNVRSLAADVIGDIGPILWILFAAVGVVLLIACGNVANLFLIRAEGRQQELALRSALGASHGRIGWVLLAESILLAIAAGALGVVLTQGTIALLRRMAPAELPRVDDIGINSTVLLFALAISLVSAAIFGLIAVFKFGRPDAMALREGSRSSDAPGRHRTRNALVVAQVALALTLMIVSGLMIRTSIEMRRVPPGFTRPEEVLTFRIAIPRGIISDSLQIARTHQQIADRLTQVPGVTSVGISSSVTMDGEDNGNPLEPEGFSVPEGTMPPLFRYKSFAPGYIETMGNRLVAGRSITWNEIFDQRPVILVSQALALKYWPDAASALGKRVRASSGNPWREIIGVVGDERDDGLNRPPTPIVYWPMLNDAYDRTSFAYAVRSTRIGSASFQRELKQAVWSVNPNLPLSQVESLSDIQARSMAQVSFTMVMLAIAASVALFLGVVGIYGVIAYVAAQRTREIGIRIALGAQIGEVRKMFLRRGLWLTAGGIALGVSAALAFTRVLASLLFGVGPMDPMTYVTVSAGLAAVALLAMYMPARRASRVDPVTALRADG